MPPLVLAPELMPATGTSYESKLAFQQELARICLSNSVWLTTVASNPSALTLRCRLGVETHTPAALCCSCTIRCTRKAGEDEWVVRQSDPQHSCRLEMEPKSIRLARVRGARRREALQQEEAEFGIEGRPFDAGDPLEEDEYDEPASEGEEDAASTRRTRPRSVAEDSVALQTTERPIAAEAERDEEQLAEVEVEAAKGDGMQQPTPKKRARVSVLDHPHISRLQNQIDRLAQSGPVELPSAANGISASTHTDLRIITGAAAKQQGWELILLGSHLNNEERASGRAFSLSCKLASKKRTKVEGRRPCGAFLKAELHHGRWSVVRSELCHNHELQPPSAPWLDAEAQLSGSSSLSSSSRQRPTPSLAAGTSLKRLQKRQRELGRPSSLLAPPSRSSSTLGVTSPFAQRLEHTHSTPPLSQAVQSFSFLPPLKLFLAAMSTSSSSLVLAAPLLLANGLDSMARLVFLLSLSEDNVNAFTSLVAERGVPKMSTLLLKKGVLEAKRRVQKEALVGDTSCIKIE